MLVHKGILVSNQAVDKKFNEHSIQFLKRILEYLLSKKIQFRDKYPIINTYNKVRIKDSVCFQIPEAFKHKYPGSGGTGSKSAVRIQFEYDLLTQEILELAVTSFNDQDRKNAGETVKNIQENELIIRDLGYVSISVLKEIEKQGADYINRLSNTKVYIRPNKKKFELVDFKNIERDMRKEKETFRVLKVYIGEKKSLKCSLIIELVPTKIREERIRKRRKLNKKKGRTDSKEYTARAGLNLFITNVSIKKIPATVIRSLYGIRWQIEIIFKAWKSIGAIHKIKKIKIHRFEFYLYAKLIFLVINWQLLTVLQEWQLKQKEIYISLYKMLKAVYISGPADYATLIHELLNKHKGTRYILMDNRLKRVNKINLKNTLSYCL